MVKSYYVKQKKYTECVPGSEKYVKAKNGRTMLKCKCAECGITKTKFVKSVNTGGSGLFIQPYALKKTRRTMRNIANEAPTFKAIGKILESRIKRNQ